MTAILSSTLRQYPHIGVRHVAPLQSLIWLRRAWGDLQHIGGASLAHGVLITILGAVLLILGSTNTIFIAAAVTGYLLVGPIMTTGACELSRRRAAGEPLGFDESLQAFARNPRALLQFGAMLAAVAIVWVVASQVMLRSLLDVPWPSLATALWGNFTDVASRAEMLAYAASGAILAVIVFAVSVVAVPLIIDRDVSALVAMWTSIRATFANLPAMLVWSALIVVLTALGFATLLLGMIIVAPLLGHATWHAYRDLVTEASSGSG